MSPVKKIIKHQEKGYIPRALALDILDEVVRKNLSPDDRLEFYLKKENYRSLPKEDIALCKSIVMITLRRWGHIEQILYNYLKKSVRSHSPRIHLIMMTAICQLIFMQSPPYAVVNLAIIQTKNDKKSYKLKLVNIDSIIVVILLFLFSKLSISCCKFNEIFSFSSILSSI